MALLFRRAALDRLSTPERLDRTLHVATSRGGRPMRFIGRYDLAGEPGRGLVPLSSWTWIELDTDSTVSAVLTPTTAITGQVWPALDRFGALVLRYASLTREEDVRRAREHHRAARRARRATEAATLRELRSVLGAASAREATADADARTPLEAAVSIVAGSIGATVEIPRRTEVEDDDLPRAVEVLVRRSGIRTRRIEFAPGWWRRDGPSFVATTTGGAGTERGAATGDGQDRAPRVLAVLSNGRGGYRAVDPEAGRTFDAGAREAAGIGRLGVKLYAPLPDAARTSGVFSVFSYALLFYYSWRLALCAGALLLVLVGATWLSARAQMRHLRRAFAAQGAVDGFVFQMITGLAKIRMANAENDALAHWANRYSEQKRATLAARRWEAGLLSFGSTFGPLATLAIFAFIFQSLLGKELQPTFGLADFLSFYAAFGQFAAAMIALTAAWTTLVGALPLFERVQPILEARPETARDGADPGDLTGRIEFANVSFRYLPEAANALDRVSFRLRPGDYVAFVGPSGSGKSTIHRLLLGFERPDSGAVFLDDHDLSSLDLPAVRSRMGVVLQNGRLSATSIFRNIAGPAPITLDEAWETARAVGFDADVRAMPMGMYTAVPEGGGGLSGGQKQRLLMARALARRQVV